MMMKPTFFHRRIGSRVAGLLLSATLAVGCSACTKALDDYLLPGEVTLPEINSDLLHADTLNASPEVSETEPEEIRYPFDGTQIHQGTRIAYVAPEESPYKDICVVIDAGHQAQADTDTEPIAPNADKTAEKMSAGQVGTFSGQGEHELNLAVAVALRNELCARGYSVVMVRESDDVNISERERAELACDVAEDFDRTVYVRIHAHASENPVERGAMVLCASKNNPTAAAAAQAEESHLLADFILERYCTGTPYVRPHAATVREDDTMTATNHSRVPTVSVVLGFLSNEVEDVSMSYNEFRRRAGVSIADGVDAYFRYLLRLDDDLPETFAVSDAPIEPETPPPADSDIQLETPSETQPAAESEATLGAESETES